MNPTIEPEVPTNCYNCNNDCMGILLDIFKEYTEDPSYRISTILVEDKGYYQVNTDFVDGKPCLTMYKNEAKKFARNMKKFGFECTIQVHDSKKSMAHVFIKDTDPRDLIYIYHQLEVI